LEKNKIAEEMTNHSEYRETPQKIEKLPQKKYKKLLTRKNISCIINYASELKTVSRPIIWKL